MNGDQPQLTKRERRELRRQEREKESSRQVRGKVMKRVSVWIVVLVLVAGGIVGIVALAKRSKAPTPGETVPEQAENHIPEGSSHEPYSTNPPTSGPHYERTEVPGFYDEELQDELIIHNLEHGAIWMTYKPSKVDQATIDRLKEIAKPYDTKMLLSPREKNDDPVAAVAWQHILRLQTLNDAAVEQINAFIKAYRNHGPENAPEETHRD